MVHEQREAVQQEESPSPEVAAFCSLIAGIVLSCQRRHGIRQEPPAQAAGRDRRANLEECSRLGLLPAAFYEDGECSAPQAVPGECRSEIALGGVRPHAQPLKGGCR